MCLDMHTELRQGQAHARGPGDPWETTQPNAVHKGPGDGAQGPAAQTMAGSHEQGTASDGTG